MNEEFRVVCFEGNIDELKALRIIIRRFKLDQVNDSLIEFIENCEQELNAKIGDLAKLRKDNVRDLY